MTLPPPRLRNYLATLPGRCLSCFWHVPTMGHQPTCPKIPQSGRPRGRGARQ